MHFKIEKVLSKPDWVAKLSAFIHDAIVLGPVEYDPLARRVVLNIRRIGYEHRQEQKFIFGLVKKWRIPYVPATLVIQDVEEISSNSIQIEEPFDADGIYELALQSEASILEISTTHGNATLRISEISVIELTDVGEPDKSYAIHAFNNLIIKPELIDEIVNRKVA